MDCAWGASRAMLGRYQKYTPKPTNIAEPKTALLSICMERLATGVQSKESTVVCCCSWWTFWTLSLNRDRSWHSSPKRLNCRVDEQVVQSLIRYCWIFSTRSLCILIQSCRIIMWRLAWLSPGLQMLLIGWKNLLQFQRYIIFSRVFWRTLYIGLYTVP